MSKERTSAADKLITRVSQNRSIYNISKDEPLTLVGHSHGGNVSIEAINKMVEMKEFEGITINLMTINTPVRSDYQLSEKAKSMVKHINIYDEKDPVQIRGGNREFTNKQRTNTPIIDLIGEIGPAGRAFDNAINIPVNNPQGVWDDFHNSHNLVSDWYNKLPIR